MRKEEREPTAVKDAAAPIVIRSAGKSRRGAGKFNWDYFCRVEYAAGGRIRGLYAVADGAPSPSRGDLASELAIETLKDYFLHYRGGQAEGASETTNLLKLCFSEINRTLMKHKIAKKDEEEEAFPMYTTLTAGYMMGNTFHVGHAGSGAVYLLSGGKIQRLTEPHAAAAPTGGSGEGDGTFAPGILGWRDSGGRAEFHSIPIEGSSVLLFCSDGVTAHMSSLALQEKWIETGTPEEMVDAVTAALEQRGAVEDATIVVVHAEAQREGEKGFVRPIRYPAHVVFRKYLIVLILGALLSTALAYRDAVVERLGARGARAAPAGVEKAEAAAPAERAAPAAGAPISIEFEVAVRVSPADAALFIAGPRVAGGSPYLVRLPGGGRVEVRAEREGFEAFSTTIDPARTESLDIKLKRAAPETGAVKIVCDEACDSISIDGKDVRAAYPRRRLLFSGIAPGAHEVAARAGGRVLRERVKTIAGRITEVSFRFPARAGGAEGDRAAAIPAAAERKGETVRPAPEPPRAIPEAPARPPASHVPERLDRVFFTVKTDVEDCTLMIFQGSRLVLTGASGDRLDLPPGDYTMEVAKDGYEPKAQEIRLDRKYQIIETRIK